MSDATPARKGFPIRCLHCGEWNTTRIDADDLCKFACTACDNETTAEEARALVDGWSRMLAWIETAPAYSPDNE